MIEISRRALGIRQEDLARLVGISRPTLVAIEHGKVSPRLNTYERMMQFLSDEYQRKAPLTPAEIDAIVRKFLNLESTPPRGPGRPKGKTECNSPRERTAVHTSASTSSTIHASKASESEPSFGSQDDLTAPTSTPNDSNPTTSSEPESKGRGFLPTVGENPFRRAKTPAVIWESGLLNDISYAGSILRQIASLEPVPQKLLGEFKSDCAKQMWALEKWNENFREKKAYDFLAKKFNIRLRKRGKDEGVQARHDHILKTVSPAISWLRKNSTHSKGAYDTRTFGFRRQMIEEVLARPDVSSALADPETGELPTVAMVERVFREAGHRVDPRSEPDNFVQETIGWRPRFAGDVILADWTGLPINIQGTAFEVLNKKTKAKERHFKKFGMHLAVDAATNFTWGDQTFGDNEFATWPRFLEWMLFDALGYAPNFLVMDRVSGVIKSLLNSDPEDKHPNVMAEVLAWVAAGVQFHVHTPERANAKGHVEVAAKLMKHRELNQLTVRRCLEKHMQGTLTKPRDLVAHSEVLRLVRAMSENANKRVISRDGTRLGRRDEIWENAEDVALREERAFTENARHEWREIVSRAKLVWVAGKTAYLRLDGKKFIAEIGGFEEAGLRLKEDATAWIVPPLPGVSVDPDQYRVCLIEDRKGMPKMHALTARISAKDRFGFDTMRPFLGAGYQSKPATNADQTKRSIDFAASTYAKSVTARQATTDEEVVEVRAV